MTVEPQMEASSGASLDRMLCFDLYAAQRALTAAYRPILHDLGLTYPQYLVLVLLWSGGAVSIKEIATRLRLDHATLTPMLRRMERDDLVLRERSELDERSVTVRLAARGEALRQAAADVQCRIAETVGLEDDEVVRLRGLLQTLTAHLDRAGPDRAPPPDPH